MKKRILELAVLTAALSVAAGTTAFAGWTQDGTGWYYVYPNGTTATMGWFTDPDTKLEYYLDPDGYMMSGTRVEGYWLDDSGVKHEKTEEELKREAEKAATEAKKPSPSKEKTRATAAAKNAASATTAVTTVRLQYQAEMKIFANKILQNAWKTLSLDEENADLKKVVNDTSVETTYKIDQSDDCTMISTSLWLMSNPKNVDYKEEAFSMTYIPNHIRTATQGTEITEAFRQLLIAAIGETEGASVYEELTTQIQASAEKYNREGQTDSGNTYKISYRYGIVNLSVVANGVDLEAEAEEAEWEAEQAAKEAEKAAKEAAKNGGATETVTSSVITAGQGETVAAETAAEETAEAEEAETSESTEETEESTEETAENTEETAESTETAEEETTAE